MYEKESMDGWMRTFGFWLLTYRSFWQWTGYVHRELPEKDLTERNLIVTFRVTFMEVCLIVDVVQTRRLRLIEQSAAES